MTDNMGKTKEEIVDSSFVFCFFFKKNLNFPLSRVYTTKETEGEKQNLRRRSNLERNATLGKD
jgi:hypothetical protein